MKIECPQCEQSYEFDDQLVPVSGYMAHCSRCAHVFFLARAGIKSLDALEQESTSAATPSPSQLDELDGDDDDLSLIHI